MITIMCEHDMHHFMCYDSFHTVDTVRCLLELQVPQSVQLFACQQNQFHTMSTVTGLLA